MTPAEQREVRELLSAIHDALIVPRPASYSERVTQADEYELRSRAAYITGALGSTLSRSGLDIAAPAQTIRQRADEPLRYKTAGHQEPEALEAEAAQ